MNQLSGEPLSARSDSVIRGSSCPAANLGTTVRVVYAVRCERGCSDGGAWFLMRGTGYGYASLGLRFLWIAVLALWFVLLMCVQTRPILC